MRIRHPSDYCLNCNFKISRRSNYCPRCGQENTDYKYAIWYLLYESVNNYLNLDSQFFRSVFPFLFRPGHLTVKFIEGRRKLYVNPIRLYLIVSIVFFFVFSQAIDLDNSNLQITNQKELDEAFGKYVLKDSTKSLEELEGMLKEKGVIVEISDLDSVAYQVPVKVKTELLSNSLDTMGTTTASVFGVNYEFNQSKAYLVWMRQPYMTPDAFLDSLNATEKNFWNRKAAAQLLKIGQTSNPKIIINEVIENISIMFFILIPFFALLLKLFYLNSKKLYYNHLIFSLHLHTYLFFIAAIFLGISFFYESKLALLEYGLLIFTIYVLLMFRRVYKQGWIKTIFKTILLFNIYLVVITIFSILEVFASLLTF